MTGFFATPVMHAVLGVGMVWPLAAPNKIQNPAPIASASAAVQTQDSAAQFVHRLSERLPQLARIRAAMVDTEVLALVNGTFKPGYYRLGQQPPLNHLTALAELLEKDEAREQAWWLLDKNVFDDVAMTLLQLRDEPRIVDEVKLLLVEMDSASALLPDGPVREKFKATRYVLGGQMALWSGDTVQAMRALGQAARIPQSPWARSAADTLIGLTTARRDTAMLITVLTLRYLQTGGNEVSKKEEIYKRLQQLYSTFVIKHGVPIDVIEGALIAPLSKSASLDEYVNRQYAALYERPFPVERWIRPGASRTPRTVVVEYRTGIACGSCWDKDRAYHALSRRYPQGQVITLAYHMDGYPVQNFLDDTDNRLYAWYPDATIIGNVFRGTAGATLPPRTLFYGERGHKKLRNGIAYINGLREAELPPYSANELASVPIYRQAVKEIDSVLQHVPEAVVHVTTNRTDDLVSVDVHVDSIRDASRIVALRVVLFEDTVYVRGATIRRVYQNVVRANAQTETMSMGLPLRARGPSTTRYVFDLAKIKAQLDSTRNPQTYIHYKKDEKTGEGNQSWLEPIIRAYSQTYFPDPRDWGMDTNHLHVVAFVQDLETGEILQAMRAKVPASVHRS